jgi:hypothetical protein
MEKTCDEVKIVEGFRRSAWQIVTNRQRIGRKELSEVYY